MKFDIWSEGYAATGESSGAMRMRQAVEAPTFKDACVQAFDNDNDRKWFNAENLTYWGCRLYPHERQARKSFG